LDEEVDMLTCNLFETVHNIWLQQFGHRGTYLFTATFNDYVQTFKQSSLYYTFLEGGASGIGLDKNELRLHRADQFGDLVKIATVVSKYILSSSLSVRISHSEGEEMFGSTKCKVDLPPRLEVYS